jgi:hypothetical protein
MAPRPAPLEPSSPPRRDAGRAARAARLAAAAAAALLAVAVGLAIAGWVLAPAGDGAKLRGVAAYGAVAGALRGQLSAAVEHAFLGDVAVMRAHLAARAPAAPAAVAVPPPRRGVVVTAGGVDQLANAFANLVVLRRHLRSTLPATLAFWGALPRERVDPATRAFFEAHVSDLTFLDLSTLPYPPHQRWLFPPASARGGASTPAAGWGFKVKVFALFAAPYDEVLLLDADAMALRDPAPLFDAPEFAAAGSLFWPDRWCHPVGLHALLADAVAEGMPGVKGPGGAGDGDAAHAEARLARRAALGRRGAEADDATAGGAPAAAAPRPQAESGQLLLDRRRHADALEWALFLNTRDEVVYRAAHGDKDTYRAAFALAGDPDGYAQVAQPLSLALARRGLLGLRALEARGWVQHAPDGAASFLHRTSAAKYGARDAHGRAFDRALLQPGCAWAERRWRFFSPAPWALWGARAPRGGAACGAALEDPARARAEPACGLAALNAPGGPALVAVAPSSAIGATQAAADAAAALFRAHVAGLPEVYPLPARGLERLLPAALVAAALLGLAALVRVRRAAARPKSP